MTEGRTHATKRHVCATRDVLEPGTQGARQPRTSQNIVSHPSPLTAQDVVGSIRCDRAADWRQPLVMAYGATGCGQARRETTKSKIRKTNLECALESTVSLFGVSLSASHIGRAGRLVAAGREAQRRRAMGADVDNTGLKRTADGIMLKVKEIIAFGANELRWVKSFVM